MADETKVTSKQPSQAQKMAELENKLSSAMSTIDNMQELLKVVKWQEEDMMRRYQADPTRCIQAAKEIVDKNRNPPPSGKRYTWRIDRAAIHKPLFIESDSANERTVIAEWEEKLGTKFITTRHNSEDNDKIELVKDAEARS